MFKKVKSTLVITIIGGLSIYNAFAQSDTPAKIYKPVPGPMQFNSHCSYLSSFTWFL